MERPPRLTGMLSGAPGEAEGTSRPGVSPSQITKLPRPLPGYSEQANRQGTKEQPSAVCDLGHRWSLSISKAT